MVVEGVIKARESAEDNRPLALRLVPDNEQDVQTNIRLTFSKDKEFLADSLRVGDRLTPFSHPLYIADFKRIIHCIWYAPISGNPYVADKITRLPAFWGRVRKGGLIVLGMPTPKHREDKWHTIYFPISGKLQFVKIAY